jgi:hypothetical protein
MSPSRRGSDAFAIAPVNSAIPSVGHLTSAEQLDGVAGTNSTGELRSRTRRPVHLRPHAIICERHEGTGNVQHSALYGRTGQATACPLKIPICDGHGGESTLRTDRLYICTYSYILFPVRSNTLTSREFTGRTRIPGRAGTGPISAVGHGGVLDLVMAPPTDRAAVFPGTRTALDRTTFLASVDSDRKHVFIAEGTFPSLKVLSACPTAGPHLRVRVHACGARIH